MKQTRHLLLSAVLLWALSAQAQYFQEDGYDYYYDYEHRVVVRSEVYCGEDYQDLWNGDYVRFINDKPFIYDGNSRITYGDKIWLTHRGYYIVKRGSTMYLQDGYGNYTGVYGDRIDMNWDGTLTTRRGSYYYLYTTNNQRIGSIYSETPFGLYWNGYYSFLNGNYYYLADEDGDRVPNSYSDEEPTLTASGNFRVYRSNRSYLITPSGQFVQ